MKTNHTVHFDNAQQMDTTPDQNVDLIVTSPPYPMIEMWDQMFAAQNPAIGQALDQQEGMGAFELMHQCLDLVWTECYRVLKPGGLACINIGDAVRTLGGQFARHSNHARLEQQLLSLGFTLLPCILWRKPTNAPSKFMGAGMLPAGAYVTLEHEHIIIARKGGKRAFSSSQEKALRRQSAFFWEERNQWFSDIWTDLKGTEQVLKLPQVRERSVAYPFDLAYRLILMYSAYGDRVLDPFLGTGTTLAAAAVTGRQSVGYEIDEGFRPLIQAQMEQVVTLSRQCLKDRINRHKDFIKDRVEKKGPMKITNAHYNFPVISKQETDIRFQAAQRVNDLGEDHFEVQYSEMPTSDFSIKNNGLKEQIDIEVVPNSNANRTLATVTPKTRGELKMKNQDSVMQWTKKLNDYQVPPFTCQKALYVNSDTLYPIRALLKDSSIDKPIESEDIEKQLGMCEWGVFEKVCGLITQGVPIAFCCVEGQWLSFTHTEGIGYWRAQKPQDLDETKGMIEDHMVFLKKLLDGVEKAQRQLKGKAAP